MATPCRLAPLLVLLSLLRPGTVLAADAEAWLTVDARVPVVGTAPAVPRLQLRAMTENWFAASARGLRQALLRGGPLVHVAPWLAVAGHAVATGTRGGDGGLATAVGGEVDVMPQARLGPIALSGRSRAQCLWSLATGVPTPHWRNQLRVEVAPLGSALAAYLADEVFLRLDTGQIDQNRAQVMLGVLPRAGLRLDVGYMLRSSVAAQGWVHAHVAALNLTLESR